jgi:hypothetical protein
VAKRSANILEQWDVTAEELTQVVDANPSLRGMLVGYLAEAKLRKMWFSRPEITDWIKYDDHDRTRKGDLVIAYKGHELVIEVKSLQTHSIKRAENRWVGKAQVDASDRRTVRLPNGRTVQTTCLLVGEFDLLAVNLFAFEDEWRFIFAKNSDLPRTNWKGYTPAQQKYLLATLVSVSWPPSFPFRDEPFDLLDEIIQERTD